MFARNCWYVAGWTQEFSDDRLYGVRIADHPIVVYRKRDGSLVAMEDRCRHRFAPLSLGCREGDDLRCMYHGLKYAPTGKCIEIPGQDKIPDIARVAVYPVAERHSWVWIWIGDPEEADDNLIPPAVGYDDGRYCLRHGQLDYEAPYYLINANLLDFSHLTYVHPRSFGAGPEFAYDRPRVSRIDRGVRVERWLENRPPTPTIRAREHGSLDVYSVYDFLVPGILLMYTGSFPQGTARRAEFNKPSHDEALESNFTSQAVTPISASTSRYFFSWGPQISTAQDANAQADGMLKLAHMAFHEDKTMIEAQYRAMQAGPHPPEMPTTADMAIVMFQRLMRTMTPKSASKGAVEHEAPVDA